MKTVNGVHSQQQNKMAINTTLLSNRKIIKRLINSEASVFCFFRKVENQTHEIIYDTIEVVLRRNVLGGCETIDFRLLRAKNGSPLSRTFIFNPHIEDKKLWGQVSNEASKKRTRFEDWYPIALNDYHSKKPEVFVMKSCTAELDESEIANFIKLDSFQLNNYYKFYTKDDFIRNNFQVEINKERDNSPTYDSAHEWKVVNKYGLILKERHFRQRRSDFGSDHYLTMLMSNPAYFHQTKPQIFYNTITPREGYPIRASFWEDVYDYFFDRKNMILVNYDEMPPYPKTVNPNKNYAGERLFNPSNDLLSNSFVISIKVDESVFEL